MTKRCIKDIWNPKFFCRVKPITELRLGGYWKPVMLWNIYAG
jgi:hypothetical protein